MRVLDRTVGGPERALQNHPRTESLGFSPGCWPRLKPRPSVRMCAGVIVALTVCARVATAQTPGVPLTLADAVTRAVETSHRLAEARARTDGAEATVRVRQAADQPTVTVSGGYSRTNHVDVFGIPQPDGALRVVYPDIPDNYRTRVEMQWPIYAGGRPDALERAARAEAGATELDLRATRSDLRLEVVRAYWALVTATESVRVLEEALTRADAHLRDVRSRFDVGLIPPNDVLTVEAQRSREEMQLIEARNQRESSATELRRLTGLPPDAVVIPVERLDTADPGTARAVPSATTAPSSPVAAPSVLVGEALAKRPERQALEQRIGGAADRIRAAEAGKLPTISLLAGVDYANPNPRIFPRDDRWRDSWDVGVNVSWALWDAGRTRAEVAEAAAARNAARERLAEFDAVTSADVRQRLLDVDSSRAVVRAAGDAVKSAAEARRVVAERFNVGVATSTDVLDAQLVLLQAELDRTRALAGVRLSEARLERALGRE
jgi:outer membrane protein